jgi:hypothetical protein
MSEAHYDAAIAPPQGKVNLRVGIAETAVQTIVGPVIVTPDGGFGFDLWTSGAGLIPGFSYRRVEDAHYARKVETGSRAKKMAAALATCNTLDEFVAALAKTTAGATAR